MRRRHKKPKARSPMAPPEIRMEDRRKTRDKRRCRGRVLLDEDGDARDEKGIAPHPTSWQASGGVIDEQVAGAASGRRPKPSSFGGSVLGAAPAGLLARIVVEE